METKKDKLCIDDTVYNTETHDDSFMRPCKTMSDPHEVRAIIPGTIVEVNVREGQQVKKGQIVLVLEAMKMYNELEAEIDGKIEKVNVLPGDKVEKDKVMIKIV